MPIGEEESIPLLSRKLPLKPAVSAAIADPNQTASKIPVIDLKDTQLFLRIVNRLRVFNQATRWHKPRTNPSLPDAMW